MKYTIIISSLESQLSQRLEKLWRVFSWCSSILVSIIAFVTALPKTHHVNFSIIDRLLISAVVAILTLYDYLWIKENLLFESKIRDQLDELYEKEFGYAQLKSLRPDKARFGYKAVIVLLGIVALTATWISGY